MKQFGGALIFGTVIAVLCAVIYYAIVEITDMQVALITIGMGWGIGKAVFLGSGERGGWTYQALAVTLTYLAIAGSLGALMITATIREENAKDPGVSQATPSDATATPTPTPEADAEDEPTLPGLVLQFLALLVAAPVLVCLDAPICFLIYGFGLYEAWKTNRPREPVSG